MKYKAGVYLSEFFRQHQKDNNDGFFYYCDSRRKFCFVDHFEKISKSWVPKTESRLILDDFTHCLLAIEIMRELDSRDNPDKFEQEKKYGNIKGILADAKIICDLVGDKYPFLNYRYAYALWLEHGERKINEVLKYIQKYQDGKSISENDKHILTKKFGVPGDLYEKAAKDFMKTIKAKSRAQVSMDQVIASLESDPSEPIDLSRLPQPQPLANNDDKVIQEAILFENLLPKTDGDLARLLSESAKKMTNNDESSLQTTTPSTTNETASPANNSDKGASKGGASTSSTASEAGENATAKKANPAATILFLLAQRYEFEHKRTEKSMLSAVKYYLRSALQGGQLAMHRLKFHSKSKQYPNLADMLPYLQNVTSNSTLDYQEAVVEMHMAFYEMYLYTKKNITNNHANKEKRREVFLETIRTFADNKTVDASYIHKSGEEARITRRKKWAPGFIKNKVSSQKFQDSRLKLGKAYQSAFGRDFPDACQAAAKAMFNYLEADKRLEDSVGQKLYIEQRHVFECQSVEMAGSPL